MGCTIFYFSGTGNSLKVARDIAADIESSSLVPVPTALTQSQTIPVSGKIGIVFPVYCWGPPAIVREFVNKLQPSPDTYVFSVATCGGMASGTHGIIQKLLKTKQTQINAGFTVKMPGNYTPLYGAWSEQKQQKCYRAQEKQCKTIAATVSEGKSRKYPRGFFLTNFIFSRLVYNAAMKNFKKEDRNFKVTEKCNSCGICQKVCPVDNITMEHNKPHWHRKCQQCMACLQWCPQEAIEFGSKTAGKKRFQNPYVTREDIIKQKTA